MSTVWDVRPAQALNAQQIRAAAEALWNAAATGRAVAPLHQRHPGMTLPEAYAVQAEVTRRRLAAGGLAVGRKLALTGRPDQRRAGVDHPVHGTLFGDGVVPAEAALPWAGTMLPRVSAGVALVMALDLPTPGITSAEVLRAVAFAVPAIEVECTRYGGWNVSVADLVADNAGVHACAVGRIPRLLQRLDLRAAGLLLSRGGEPVSTGVGSHCMGHPLNALAWLANRLAMQGQGLGAGDVVLTGALGPSVPARPGDRFEARIEGLGSVALAFEA